VPYLSALEVCSRQGAIQINVYLYFYFPHRRAVTLKFGVLNRVRSGEGPPGTFLGCFIKKWYMLAHFVHNASNRAMLNLQNGRK